MKKKLKSGLLVRIVIAIAAGIGVGYVEPMWLARIFATFNEIFGQFLGFMIPMIIVGFVAPAIADLGKSAGKMLVVTAVLAYIATLFAGFGSYFTGAWLFPSMISPSTAHEVVTDGTLSVEPYFTMPIPTLMSVMTALILSFMLGIGAAVINGTAVKKGLCELRDIVALTINKAIIPLLPIYIFGIFSSMTVEGQVGVILTTFVKIIAVIFVMHIVLLLLQYCVAALVGGGNPIKMLWTMMPAYFTALGTQSSAATIPVTLRQTIKMGVSEDVAGFTVPLCATIHMSGSTLKIVACALAIMIMEGIPYDIGMFSQFIAMLGVTIIAAPGIPGGAIMASLGLLSGILGFSDEQNAMMIALYIAMDSFGTACNVTGDGALAVIVERIMKGKKKSNVTFGHDSASNVEK
ncbi:MAG: dicarboxylate/amino acid:cation symporter [Bacteroides sp.]|nr:dicarboxylate/amino acid:cation symporter [Bacteroides sp.]MCM1413331.1 dicarboxylate/amino acid:cation symporter [Bacteroides sp.]MCM1471983.1 dicarboxylate/amino acid:cation symporter [Bacteroides sp.]